MKESLVGLILLATSLFASPVMAAGAVPKVYICPSCGCPNDNQAFEKPGRCPGCGMALVERTSETIKPQTSVAVLLFDGAQIIDYAGPWEAFGEAGFKIFTVAEKAGPIHAVYGQNIMPDYTFANCPRADILLVPGGGGVHQAMEDRKLLDWVQQRAGQSQHVMSVCTGAFILAKAGLLDGLTATTVSGAIERLGQVSNTIKVVHDQRYVDNGKIITAAGLSSGIDAAFHLIGKIRGQGTAQEVALGMEYQWDPESRFARAALADRYFPDVHGVDAEIVSTHGDRDHWELNFLVSKPAKPVEVLELLGKRVSEATPHVRGPVTVTASTGDVRWEFNDDQGSHWTGIGSAEASKTSPDKVQLQMKLEKAPGQDAKATVRTGS